jgi:hypothetical protein
VNNLLSRVATPAANFLAGDVYFVALYVDSISGFAPVGGGADAPDETVDLNRQAIQTK